MSSFVSRVELVCDPDVLAILRELMPVEIALDENRASKRSVAPLKARSPWPGVRSFKS